MNTLRTINREILANANIKYKIPEILMFANCHGYPMGKLLCFSAIINDDVKFLENHWHKNKIDDEKFYTAAIECAIIHNSNNCLEFIARSAYGRGFYNVPANHRVIACAAQYRNYEIHVVRSL
jgi:hypothetical protein